MRSIAQEVTIDRPRSDDRSPKKLQRTYSNATVKNPTELLSTWTMRSIAKYRAIDRTSSNNGQIVQRGAIDRKA